MRPKPTAAELRNARLLGLVLPEAERRELERRYGPAARPAGLSAIVGLLEVGLGVAVYAGAHPGFGGGFGWVVWHLSPLAWLGLLIMLTGMMRGASYVTHQDSLGEPLVWAGLRLWQLHRGIEDRRRIEREFGPPRPDRVVVDRSGELMLLASRPKADWDEYRTVRIEDEFFKIAGVEERRDGAYLAVAYRLQVVPESEPLRGIVHTDACLPTGYDPR